MIGLNHVAGLSFTETLASRCNHHQCHRRIGNQYGSGFRDDGIVRLLPWQVLGGIALIIGLPEIGASALISFLVIVAVRQIKVGKRQGSEV